MEKKIVLVTGGFDPLHSGHLVYFDDAKKLGDKLIVGINSDDWLINKKGKFFMPLSERSSIIEALSAVDGIVTFELLLTLHVSLLWIILVHHAPSWLLEGH